MKILHCADLHMDSPMETHMTREQAAKRNAEILMSFQRMTEYAEKEKVRVVLIAGDLFDGTRYKTHCGKCAGRDALYTADRLFIRQWQSR